jgi:hypothetical protein
MRPVDLSLRSHRTQAAVLGLGLVVAAALALPTWEAIPTKVGALHAARPTPGTTAVDLPFSVSGASSLPVPGQHGLLGFTISNPNAVAIRITALTAAAGDESSECPGAALTVGPLSGDVLVPAHGTAPATLPISVGSALPGACQGATFTFAVSGTAAAA